MKNTKLQKRNSLTLLYEINEYINQTKDIKVNLKGILKIIKNFYSFDILFLYLWNSKENRLILEASTEKEYKIELSPGEGLAGSIYQTQQIISSRNIMTHPHYKSVIKSQEKEYMMYLGVPVLLQAYCTGVLEIWNKKDNSITQNQQKIIRIICSRISGLLEVSDVLERLKSPDSSEGQSTTYYGFPLSKGIAIGKSYIVPELLQNEYFDVTDNTPVDIEVEKLRISEGFSRAIREMEILIKNIKNKSISESEIKIFQAHLLMLRDETFLDKIIKIIETKRLKAEVCLSEYIETMSQKFKKMEDPYFQDRAYDFIDIGERIILVMQSQNPDNLSFSIPDNSIVIAEYISPALLVSLDKSKIKGIIVEKGGRSSHTAILAQALNIPAVSEIAHINHLITQNTHILLDGSHGIVIANPEEQAIINYQNEIKKEKYIRTIFEQKISSQNKIQNKINIAANISFYQDIKWARKYSIQSTGLFRSEFFFMRFSSWPGVKEQIAVYKELAESFLEEVTIRLLDVGADKKLPYLKYKSEENPLLGLRSIRFLLKNQDLLYSQLFAILSAYKIHTNIRILLPMITTTEEIISIKSIIRTIKDELTLHKTPDLGIMIEVPTVLYQIEDMSKEVDFFSIGTNDLIQYLLAVDRESVTTGELYSDFQPAVIRMLYQLNELLANTGKKTTVCGEMAGNPSGALCLAALGYTHLSIYPAKAPIINYLCTLINGDVLDQVKKKLLTIKDKNSLKDMLKETLISLDPIFAEVL